jgi:hypothetical protein
LSTSLPLQLPAVSTCSAWARQGIQHNRRKFHQFTGMGGLVHHHQHLGRVEIQRHGPGGGHHVLCTRVGRGNQHGRAVVQQAIALGQINSNKLDIGLFLIMYSR